MSLRFTENVSEVMATTEVLALQEDLLHDGIEWSGVNDNYKVVRGVWSPR